MVFYRAQCFGCGAEVDGINPWEAQAFARAHSNVRISVSTCQLTLAESLIIEAELILRQAAMGW